MVGFTFFLYYSFYIRVLGEYRSTVSGTEYWQFMTLATLCEHDWTFAK